MTLRLQFVSKHAMWRALREYFWNASAPRQGILWGSDLVLGLGSKKVRYDPSTYHIDVDAELEELPKNAHFAFDGLQSWSRANVVVEMPLRKAAANG